MFGLLNNVAEVTPLRQKLLEAEYLLEVFRDGLRSPHVHASYFCGGIIAHLLSCGEDEWTLREMPFVETCDELEVIVSSWTPPDSPLVTYKSFLPFLGLLRDSTLPQGQLWALWALHHVSSMAPEHYLPMLRQHAIADLLHHLTGLGSVAPHYVRALAAKVLALMVD